MDVQELPNQNATIFQEDFSSTTLVVPDTSMFGEALIVTDTQMAVIYISIVSAALVIGTLGNILILVIAILFRNVNKVGKPFIVNLAIADLCVASVADPMCILGVVKGEVFFNDKPWLCHVTASLCLTACFCAFISLTMLTVHRYIYICHHNIFDKIFNRYMCITFCMLCWILAFLFEFPNIIGWGGHLFDKKTHQCIWDRTASDSYTLLVSVGLIGGPLIIMACCYFLIFRHIWECKRDIYKFETDNPLRMRKAWNETTRNCHALFVLFFVFLVCWTPYAIVIAVDVRDTLSVEIHLFVTLLAHLHSSSNCTVYTIFNKQFRTSVARLFGCKANLDKSINSDDKNNAYTLRQKSIIFNGV